jgi:sulfoxide reductase catalytic subunit YedY
MLLKAASDIQSSQITPQSVYLNRRKFIARGSAAVAGLAMGRTLLELLFPSQTVQADTKLSAAIKSPFSTNEKQTPYNDVTHYNNFYEFGVSKEEPAEKAKNFKTSPWTLAVGGAVKKSETFDLDSLMRLAPLEERVCRHRCVKAWSIVVPWIGFPLNALVKQVEPTSQARYVSFQSLYDPKQMPESALRRHTASLRRRTANR